MEQRDLSFFIRVSRIAIEALEEELVKKEQHIEALEKEIKRHAEVPQTLLARIDSLECIIRSAEYAGNGKGTHITCPWCAATSPAESNSIDHFSTCVAFASCGEVRR